MIGLNLKNIAIDLLIIDRDFYRYVKNPDKYNVSNFKLHTFDQLWSNTSGGFQGIGGSAMTVQRTYVFVPTINTKEEECLVFFGERFAYYAPFNQIFMDDVKNQNIAGIRDKSKYDK